MNKRKGFSTKISSSDQSIVKYIYYNYDSDEIQQIKLTIQKGQLCLKDGQAGQIFMKNQNINANQNQSIQGQIQHNSIQLQKIVINFIDSGSVESISSNLQQIQTAQGKYYTVKKSILKKPVLELFQMKLCEHIPQEKVLQRLINQVNKQKQVQKQQKNNKKVLKKQKVQPIFCKYCHIRLYYFYLPQQKSINYKDIQSQLNAYQLQNIENIQWQVTVGQSFTKDTQIAKYESEEYSINQNGKITFLIDWKQVSDTNKNLEVLRYKPVFCQHQKIQFNVCQYCFQSVDPVVLNLKKYLFQMEQSDEFKREMITSGSTLTQQQNIFVDTLLEKQKGILILDLDNTVLHSVQLSQIPRSRLQQIQQYYQLMMGRYAYFNDALITSYYIVKMRPYFKQFIQTAIRYYEIYVYTKGTRLYAEQICSAIRNQYGSKQYYTNNKNQKLDYFDFLKDKNAFKPNRIITRDQDPNLQKKSLDNILPTRQQSLMVMDDLGTVWNYSSCLLYTVPYHFFFKKKAIQSRIQKDKGMLNNKSIQALDISKQGIPLQPVQDLNVTQNIEPVRQLPCDHFQRQILELQNNKINIQVAPLYQQIKNDLKKIELSNQRKQQEVQIIFTNGQNVNQQTLNCKAQVIQLDKPIVQQDKQHNYDIFPRSDYYLIFAAESLIKIHEKFFNQRKNHLNNHKNNEPIKKISFSHMHKQFKNQILQGKKVCFCMKSESKIDIYSRALKVGCKVVPNNIQQQNQQKNIPQYVIRLNNIKDNLHRIYYSKQQQNERLQTIKNQPQIHKQTIKQLKYYSQTLKIPVVSESWIEFCYCFSYDFPVQPFIIDQDQLLSEVHQQQYQWVIQQHARKLLSKLRVQNNLFYKKNNQNNQKQIQDKRDNLENSNNNN